MSNIWTFYVIPPYNYQNKSQLFKWLDCQYNKKNHKYISLIGSVSSSTLSCEENYYYPYEILNITLYMTF